MNIVTTTEEGVKVLSREQISGNAHSRTAALLVFCLSALLVFGMVGLLYWTAHNQNNQINEAYGNIQLAAQGNTELLPLRVELEYQQLKNTRISNALIYRFSVSIIGILVSLITIILGGVLIFDRIVSVTPSTIGADDPRGYKLNASSPYPGFGMVTFGFLALVYTVYAAGPGAPKIVTIDVPVFTQDLNPLRFAAGTRSSLTTNASSTSEQQPLVSLEGEEIDFGTHSNDGANE